MTVKKYFKSVLTLASLACLSITTFAGWEVQYNKPAPLIRHIEKTVVISDNHKITVEGNLKSHDFAGDLLIRTRVSWLNENPDKADFKITEVIKYAEDGMEVEETNIFSEIEGTESSQSAENIQNEIIDGKKYITNKFKCFSLDSNAQRYANVYTIADCELDVRVSKMTAGPYNNKMQSYNPTKISSHSLFRGIFFSNAIYWFKGLKNIGSDGFIINPNYLEYYGNDSSLATTSRVILKLADDSKELGILAHNFEWECILY